MHDSATRNPKLHCPSCDKPVPHGAESCAGCGLALPRSVKAAKTKDERGWGDGTRHFKCEGCGAEVIVHQNDLKVACAYCGNERVLEQTKKERSHADDIRPDQVLPFKLKKAEVTEDFRRWVKSLWFAPGDLWQMAHEEKIRGVYLPYWCYDVTTKTHYDGEYGVDRTETEEYHEDGKRITRTKTITTWFHRHGWSHETYEDVLVLASRTVDRGLCEQVEPFHLKHAVPFSTELLTGWEAERYTVDHEKAWEKVGQPRIVDWELERCSRIVGRGADHTRGVSVTCHFTDLESTHLLLPFYVSGFRYNGKLYHYVVNGQTGQVKGERPWSTGKIVLFALAIAAVVAAIVLLVASQTR
jgi:DNA-directed RNA polymerase subunit RPC12/RpoP